MSSSFLCQTSPEKTPLHKLATYLSCDPCSERGWTLSILNLPGTPHHWIKLTFLPLKPAGLEDCCLLPGLYSCLFLHFLHLFSWTCRSCSVLLTAVLCDMWKLFKNPKCFVQCILGRWCLAKRNNTNLQNLLHETNVFKSGCASGLRHIKGSLLVCPTNSSVSVPLLPTCSSDRPHFHQHFDLFLYYAFLCWLNRRRRALLLLAR